MRTITSLFCISAGKKFSFRGCRWKGKKMHWSQDEIVWIKAILDLFTKLFGGDFLDFSYSPEHGTELSEASDPRKHFCYDHDRWRLVMKILSKHSLSRHQCHHIGLSGLMVWNHQPQAAPIAIPIFVIISVTLYPWTKIHLIQRNPCQVRPLVMTELKTWPLMWKKVKHPAINTHFDHLLQHSVNPQSSC